MCMYACRYIDECKRMENKKKTKIRNLFAENIIIQLQHPLSTLRRLHSSHKILHPSLHSLPLLALQELGDVLLDDGVGRARNVGVDNGQDNLEKISVSKNIC